MTEKSFNEFSPSDKIIAVMGPPGAGKTNFVAKASGKGEDAIGHDLQNPTSGVRIVRASTQADGHSVVFVDAPGFDDGMRTDMEILGLIADYLVKIYKEHIKLAGIIYVHPISKNRMDGTQMNSLRVFKNICGENMSGVTIVTSMWGDVSEYTGEGRENELKNKFWKEYMANGCVIERFHNTHDSAWRIVSSMLSNPGITLSLQQEIVDQDKPLSETKAAHAVSGIRALLNKLGW